MGTPLLSEKTTSVRSSGQDISEVLKESKEDLKQSQEIPMEQIIEDAKWAQS